MNTDPPAIQFATQLLAPGGARIFRVHGVTSPGPTAAEARCGCGDVDCKSPGKHPVRNGWQDEATTDIDVIASWFSCDECRNYGVALDGVEWTVVEVDPYEGGSLRALREIVGELGPISVSGRGFHVWFRGTSLPNGTKLGPGMTVRAAGYYVVGPGSKHYTGRTYGRRTYGFDKLGERPALTIVATQDGHADATSRSRIPRAIPEEIFDGEERWRHLLSVAGTMHWRGLGEATTLEAVRAVNQNQCRPPKDDADVVRLVRWVFEHNGETEGCREHDLRGDTAAGSPMTVAEIVDAFDAATSFEGVFALFHQIDPPLDPIDRQLLRRHLGDVLKKWRIPARSVDAWFKAKADEQTSRAALRFEDVEPWPEPVEGAELIRDLEMYITRFVQAPASSILAACLWCLWTWCYDLFDIAPLLVLTSPTKRCGKTTMLKLIGLVSARPLFSSNLTGAVLFRVIEKHAPTLLIDEADNFANFNDDLKGLLNAGHEKMTAQATRLVGDNHEPQTFSTWAPKAFTSIGSLPDTIEDRSIRIVMVRKPPAVWKDHARRKVMRAAAESLTRRCLRWAMDNEVALRSMEEPDLDTVHDRAADNWAPLLMIASLCGEEVRRRAETAAQELTLGEDAGINELLLAHIREAFDGMDRISTTDLLKALVNRDDGPWAKWWAADVNDSDRIKKAAADLAGRLRKFDPHLKATEKTVEGQRSRGFDRAEFEDIWERYVPAEAREEPQMAEVRDGETGSRPNLEHLAYLEQEPLPAPRLTSDDGGVREVREVREDQEGLAHSSPQPARSQDDPSPDELLGSLLDGMVDDPPDGTPGDPLDGVAVETVNGLCNEHEGDWIAIATAVNASGCNQPDGKPWTAESLELAWLLAGGGC